MEQLYRVGDTDWWILVDTEKKDILNKYHKPQVEADINAIEETLKNYPELENEELYLEGIISLVNKSTYSLTQKENAIKLLNNMWLSYNESPNIIETIQLKDKLDSLRELLERLV